MRHTKLTYGPKKAQGLSALNITEVRNGKPEIVGEFPIPTLLPK